MTASGHRRRRQTRPLLKGIPRVAISDSARKHEARGADQLITNAIDAHLQGEQSKDDDDEDGSVGVLVPAG